MTHVIFAAIFYKILIFIFLLQVAVIETGTEIKNDSDINYESIDFEKLVNLFFDTMDSKLQCYESNTGMCNLHEQKIKLFEDNEELFNLKSVEDISDELSI